MKRLFILAAYDRRSEVSEALVYYARALSACGDVIFVADNTLKERELSRLDAYTKARIAESHHEYDFGSYKRGYAYAVEKGLLSRYDRLYLVNDSVYGPLYELERYLSEMEASGAEATALTFNPHHSHPHLESWFMGFGERVFHAPWFAAFLNGVEALYDKGEVCTRYENGLSDKLQEEGIRLLGLFTVHGKEVYNKPCSLFKKGLPFFKRDSIIRHNGACRYGIRKILEAISPEAKEVVEKDIIRLYGENILHDIHSARPLNRAVRVIGYALKKWA